MSESFVAQVPVTTTSGTPSVTIPTGVQGQDTMFLLMGTATTSITPPAGWSVEQTQNPISGLTMTVLKKIAAGTIGVASSDVATVVTLPPASGGVHSAVSFIAWRGVDPSAAVYYAFQPYTSGASPWLPDYVTPTQDGCDVISVFMDKDSVAITITPPSGYTLRSSALGSGTGKINVVVASKAGGSAGNVGADNWITDATPGVVGIFTIALVPQSGRQTIRPTSDIGGVTSNVTGVGDAVNLWANVDENTLNTADYNEFVATGVTEQGCADLPDPGSLTGWSCDYVLGLTGTATSASWAFVLYQGTTVIASWTDSNTTDAVAKSHTFTSGDLAGLTLASGKYASLRVKQTCTAAS